jgi:hypothetical protein
MSSIDDQKKKSLINLGAWMGRHQTFALVANRCSAADAECLKQIHDSGEYKELDVNWEQFCVQYAGVSRAQAERHIQCFEEFGVNYRRMAELMSLSPGTFRLIAGSVTDRGLEFRGEYIPLVPENAAKLASAVKAIRGEHNAKTPSLATVASLQKNMEKLVTTASAMASDAGKRGEVILARSVRYGSHFLSAPLADWRRWSAKWRRSAPIDEHPPQTSA